MDSSATLQGKPVSSLGALQDDFRIGDWLVQPSLNIIGRWDSQTRIRPKSMAVLIRLADANGEVVSKRTLFAAVWGNAVVSDDVLIQAIVELRRAFREAASAPLIVATVPRRGYRLLAPVTWLEPESADDSDRSRPSRKLRIALTVCGAIALVTIATMRMQNTAEPLQQGVTVAVLPFVSLSSDPADAFFADGIQESVIHRLAQSRHLSVIARTSVLQYEGTEQPIPEIADELGVTAVMEGSVRHEGNRVMVTAQLADGRTGVDLWSQEYDEELDQIFSIQTDIATRIAASLLSEFTNDEQARLSEAPTDSLEAYARYLQVPEASPEERLALLDEAIALDPEFALAFVTRSELHTSRLAAAIMAESVPYFDVPWKIDEQTRLALEDVEQALTLDPQLGRAYAVRGTIYLNLKDIARAEKDLDRARELSPNDPVVLGYISRFKLWVNEIDEARELLRRFARADPRNEAVAAALFLTGDIEQGYEVLRRAAASEPTNAVVRHALGVFEALRGNRAAAGQALELAENLFGRDANINPSILARMAFAYGRIGREDDAERLAARVLGDARSRYADRALVSLATGDNEQTYRWMAKMPDVFPVLGFLNVLALQLNAVSEPALDEPRFLELRRRMATN
jgi:TolB-like protein/DNA-binding winged helix-turn-helix (wHTH) protein/Flp pilus assembly protein TadD